MVSLFGIQETNRNFERTAMLDSFHNVIWGISLHHHGVVSSAKLQLPTDYQPGGTAVSVQDQWASRFLTKGSDDLVRWSWITLTGRGTTKITFISGYRVCNGASESSITSRTVRSQQEWMYADRGLPQVDLRKQFVKDIISLIQLFTKQGHDIILMMDANEASGDGSAADTISIACGLQDAHSLSLDLSPPPATYHRGSAKIDFVLVSPRAATAVRAASILALHDGYLSDHRALVVDFDASILFAGATSQIVPPATRRLTSTNPKAVHTYIHHMLKHIALHGVVDQLNKLQLSSENGTWGDSDIQAWEKIDHLLVLGRTAAENKCPPKKSGKYPWSPDLDLAGRTVLYWKLRLREFTSRDSNLMIIDRLALSLHLTDEDKDWMPSKEAVMKLRSAVRSFKKVKSEAAELREGHLAEMANLTSALHRMLAAAASKAIAAREKASKQFRQLRHVLNTTSASGLERIDVPNTFAVL